MFSELTQRQRRVLAVATCLVALAALALTLVEAFQARPLSAPRNALPAPELHPRQSPGIAKLGEDSERKDPERTEIPRSPTTSALVIQDQDGHPLPTSVCTIGEHVAQQPAAAIIPADAGGVILLPADLLHRPLVVSAGDDYTSVTLDPLLPGSTTTVTLTGLCSLTVHCTAMDGTPLEDVDVWASRFPLRQGIRNQRNDSTNSEHIVRALSVHGRAQLRIGPGRWLLYAAHDRYLLSDAPDHCQVDLVPSNSAVHMTLVPLVGVIMATPEPYRLIERALFPRVQQPPSSDRLRHASSNITSMLYRRYHPSSNFIFDVRPCLDPSGASLQGMIWLDGFEPYVIDVPLEPFDLSLSPVRQLPLPITLRPLPYGSLTFELDRYHNIEPTEPLHIWVTQNANVTHGEPKSTPALQVNVQTGVTCRLPAGSYRIRLWRHTGLFLDPATSRVEVRAQESVVHRLRFSTAVGVVAWSIDPWAPNFRQILTFRIGNTVVRQVVPNAPSGRVLLPANSTDYIVRLSGLSKVAEQRVRVRADEVHEVSLRQPR